MVPNSVTYTILIGGHCKEGNFAQAFKLLDRMIGEGCSLSICTYNEIIDGF